MVSNVNVKLVILGFWFLQFGLVLHPPGATVYCDARTEWNSHDAKQRVWFSGWLHAAGTWIVAQQYGLQSTLWLLLQPSSFADWAV